MILKRKIGGSWVEVTRNFPTQIPVEITQTDVQIATGTVTFSQSEGQSFGTGTINVGFVPDIIFFGPLECEGEPYTGAIKEIGNVTTLLTDNIDSNQGGFIYVSTPNAFASTMTLRCVGNTWSWGSASTNGLQVPWMAIKYS